jgi:hypothetical protein
MGWHYSNGGATGYAYSLLNTYNQHCAAIGGLTPGTAIIKLKVRAAGYTGAVQTRLVAWGPGGIAVTQSSTFTMADGSSSTQYTYERSVSAHVMQGDTVWVGVYRHPAGSHVMGTASGSGNGYRKTNTNSYPSVLSMSGYNTDSNDEPYVGVFMIGVPDPPTSAAVSRNSDTSQTISWTRNASDDRPVYTQYLQRWDNVSNNWYTIKTVTTDYTTNGTHSYTDNTTVANRQYRYRMRSYNSAGYSSYDYTNYIHTTPAKPTNVSAARSGSSVKITWTDNSYQEDLFRIQRRESTDGGDTWGSWSNLDTVGTGVTEYTDLSPYAYGQYRVQAEEGTYQSTLYSGYNESGDVVTLSQPDAPTGLSANIGIGDEDKIFSWNHNPTDNTAQTKFSLRIKVSGGTYPKEIESFKDYNEWTMVGSDIVDLIQGPFPNSGVYMADEDDSESYVGMYKNPSSIDLTQFDDASASTTADLIVFTVYIYDVSYYTNLAIKLGDDNSNCYYYEVDPSVGLVNGWNQISVAKSAFTTAGSPSGWDDITYVRIELYALDNSAYNSYIVSQYLQLVKVTDFTNYAGDYFIQYHEVELTAEQLNIVANSFKNGNTYNWQVKTWGEYSTGSDWSNTATYFTVSRPIGIITSPTDSANYGLSQLTMDWNYTQVEGDEQIQFLVNLYDSTGVLLESHYESSNVANGGSDSYTFNYTLENEQTYRVTLQVQSENEFWSEETETEFTTEFLQPTKPTFELTLDNTSGSIDIDITNPEIITEYNNNSTQDTYIDSDNSGINYNDNGQLQLEDDTTGGTTVKRILLDFDFSFFVGKTIVSADLQLFRKTTLTPGIASKVNYIKTSWDETLVTDGTIPTLDTTDYDDHSHIAGEIETWDLKLLLDDIADETITDFEGLAIVPTTTDGSIDEFYDSTFEGSEPVITIEISPLNAETDYNKVYRSIDGGEWLLVEDNVPVNTTIRDHIPSVGGNNNYYVQSISSTPSSNNSDEVDLDVLLTGAFFINGGNNFEDYVKLDGDVSLTENRNREETIKQYLGRTYPVKYQGNNINHSFNFSAYCIDSKRAILVDIIESIGDIYYRDWRGNWCYVMLSGSRFKIKDPEAYTFNTSMTRVEKVE